MVWELLKSRKAHLQKNQDSQKKTKDKIKCSCEAQGKKCMCPCSCSCKCGTKRIIIRRPMFNYYTDMMH